MKNQIPAGKSARLFLYDNLSGALAWAANLNEARTITGRGDTFIRVAHAGINPPSGYHKPNGHLAFDAIEKKPTVRGFIRATTA